MRLWHWKLIPYLPKSQLIAQWRELNSIFRKEDNHILINYIYDYPKEDLYVYSLMVIQELFDRDIKIRSFNNIADYFVKANVDVSKIEIYEPFKNHQNDRYLMQCFYNLQEKYDRGQEDFSEDLYNRLDRFVNGYDCADIEVHCDIYDKVDIYDNCIVRVFYNSVTGDYDIEWEQKR